MTRSYRSWNLIVNINRIDENYRPHWPNQSHAPGTITWPAVIEAYNRQQNDERLRIGRVQCGIYFVAAKARGAAGSHHNKFCINDRGVAATLGASIANQTKDSWMDGGCIAVSAPLAASQRDYFLDVLMGEHAVHCAHLRMDGSTPSMAPLKDTALNLLIDRSARIWIEYAAQRFYARHAAEPLGRLTIRHYAPNEQLALQQNINTRHKPVLHAKNYVLTRNDGSCVVMTGSYNLDGQSHYRSNENLMLFETTDADLRKALFDELSEGSDSPVSRYPAPGARAL
jgi:hypothetical protein